jgi:AraC-like DNA-binding protein
MSAIPYTLLATVALAVWRALESYGCDSEALFRRVGIDPACLRDPDARLSDSTYYKLWRQAVDATGDACFGLTVARFVHPTSLHALGYSWMASENLKDAMERLVRYFRILGNKEYLELEERSRDFRLVLHNPAPEYPTADEDYDASVAILVQLCRVAYGANISPLKIALPRPPPPCPERFSQALGADTIIEFNADVLSLTFDKALLLEPLPTANAELARANDQILTDYLARFDRERITMRVKLKLIEQLPSGHATQESIAKALNISPRSLQRKLQDEGTTYKQLVDDTRRELAAQYVRQSRIPINEITYLLGFSEPSNFARAFKRWTGESPSDFRMTG